MRLKVIDPDRLIAAIDVLLETPACMILHVGLTHAGKRAEVEASVGFVLSLSRGTQITVYETPFAEDGVILMTLSGRYSLWLCWFPQQLHENARTLYEATAAEADLPMLGRDLTKLRSAFVLKIT